MNINQSKKYTLKCIHCYALHHLHYPTLKTVKLFKATTK